MNDLWPLFDLRIETPRLTIRYPNDGELAQVAQAATTGIHEPESMPFYIPWSRAEPPMLQRNVLQFAWSCRGSLSPTSWQLPMVVFEGGRAIGIQDLFAKEFPTTRAVETGSWLIKAAQGRGIGKEMRAGVLHLAFEHLHADEAYSASFEDNPASAAVSVANGYQPNGTVILAREGRPARNLKWALTREQWLSRRRDDIRISGIAQCLELLGVDQAA
jgi:RimJ/RimL family protein N-acetyltransferase